MTEPTTARVASLHRYPVKGLSPQTLDAVALRPGETLPFDRAYAIEAGSGRFDPERPRHFPKINFLMLMRHERLAALETLFDEGSQVLTIRRDGRQVARGDLSSPLGRRLLEQFLAAYMAAELRGPPRIVSADGHSFSDKAEKCVHLVNLATLRALERAFGRPLDPMRFRANVYVEGAEAWAELDWLHRDIAVGDARLHVFARTGRCEATNVDPSTGKRDMAIPATLLRTFGHDELGVYARVAAGATVRQGDPVRLAD